MQLTKELVVIKKVSSGKITRINKQLRKISDFASRFDAALEKKMARFQGKTRMGRIFIWVFIIIVVMISGMWISEYTKYYRLGVIMSYLSFLLPIVAMFVTPMKK